ncbi:MAG: hypothetical protein ABIT83_12355, partial [Massilia sp.]
MRTNESSGNNRQFSDLQQAVLGRIGAISAAFRRSRRTSGFSDDEAPAGQHQIGEGEQCEQL